MAGVADTDWILDKSRCIPKLLLFGGVLSRWKDRVEDVFSVGVGDVLWVHFFLH